MKRNDRLVRVFGILLLLAIVNLMLLADFAIVPLMYVFDQRDWGAIWVYGCFGVICAQGGLLSALLVWGPGPFWLRLALHWISVTECVVVWSGGLLTTSWGKQSRIDDELIPLILILPLIGLAIQLPLWTTRHYLGWRLVSNEASVEPQRGMSISDLLVGTLIASVSLGLVRAAAYQERDIWTPMAFATPFVCAVATVSLLPIGFSILRLHRWRIGLAVIGGETVVAAAIILITVILMEPRIHVWDLLGLMLVLTSFVAVLVAAAVAARAAGFRLARGARAPESATERVADEPRATPSLPPQKGNESAT